ncbi:glutamate-gated chloride channel-like protein [Leptotrombidium deliense]|uniref:Glutamate-gated chloride channel-like protein n=1 Tax=Leptotrombidium deliense TaxID=299467 RepID=A0A443SC52_9ACAR|nr:glutamate-gated chloride channel-like protein [Leptotrombidium deliense]
MTQNYKFRVKYKINTKVEELLKSNEIILKITCTESDVMTYEKDSLRFYWSQVTNTRVTNTSSFRSLNAYLIKNKTGECRGRHSWRSEYSCLSVLLVFTRDKSFYFSTVFVPGIVLVTSSFISFWLDVNAIHARVMIGVTTMLNFCTTTNK